MMSSQGNRVTLRFRANRGNDGTITSNNSTNDETASSPAAEVEEETQNGPGIANVNVNANANANPQANGQRIIINPHAYSGRVRFQHQMVPNLTHQLSSQTPQPLEEQPHISDDANPNSNSNNNGDTKDCDQPELKELECGICYDILQKPSYCGSCSARYCHSCFLRALQQSKSCPSCRKFISSPNDVVLDDSFFRKDIYAHISKVCKYPNCLKDCHVGTMRDHDAICEHKPMKCKYAPYGCTWYGPRKDLKGHYSVGCSVQTLAPLIEGARQQEQLVRILNTRLVQERQASSQMRNALLSLQTRDRNNLFDMMHMIYAAMCTPGKFLTKAIIWRNFWNCRGLRSLVNNFICLVPICMYTVKHFFRGLGHFSILLDSFREMHDRDREHSHDGAGHGTVSTVSFHFMEAMLCICTLILGLGLLLCFFADCPSPREWSIVPLRVGSYRFRVQILRFSAYITCGFLHFLCIELECHHNDFNVKGLFVAFLLQLTFFLHPMVEAMLTVAAETPVPANTFPTGRALDVVQMGLTFGTMFALFDLKRVPIGLFLYTLGLTVVNNDRIIEKRLGRNMIDLRLTFLGSSTIAILPYLLQTIGSMREIGVDPDTPSSFDLWTLFADSMKYSLPVCLYISVGNYLAIKVRRFGEKLGRKMSHCTLQTMQTQNRQPRSQGFQPYLGPICFISWTLLICTIMVI